MTHPEGGFYSAEDADSEGEEGKFYQWTAEEIVTALDSSEAKVFQKAYNVRLEGNFAEESTGRRSGTNILYRTVPDSTLAS